MKKFAASLITSIALIASAPVFADAPVDPAAVKAVNDLLVAMKYKQLVSTVFQQMSKAIPAIIRQAANDKISKNPKLTPEQQKSLMASAEKSIPDATAALDALLADPTLADEMGAAIVPLYARHFSVGEIEQMTAFYQSPVGAKMLSVMPQLMAESMQLSQKIMMPRVSKLIDKFTPEPPK